jgi:hypothetical protein
VVQQLTARTRIVLMITVAVATILFAVIYWTSPDKRALNAQLATTLIQFVVILFFGALVADYFKRIETQRKDDEALAMFRDEIRERLDECYQQVKQCRSRMRSAGVAQELCHCNERVTPECLEAYRSQMERLNELQLDLEKVWHEVECFSTAFQEAKAIINRIKIMSGFLRRLLTEYEEHWSSLRGGSEESSERPLESLKHFVGPSTEGWFRSKFCDRYSEAVDLIRRDTLKVKM